MTREPVTLAKIGNYRPSLEKVIGRFDGGGWCILKLEEAVRWVLFEKSREPYLLTVTRQKREPLIYNLYQHNTVLTVTSYSPERTQEIIKRFLGQTEMLLDSDAQGLLSKKLENEMNPVFQAFVKRPKESRARLTSNNGHYFS